MAQGVSQKVVIKNKLGLHARAASQFVKLATQFSCDVFVSKDGQEVNGKSIMGVLMLVASKGTTITLTCDGSQSSEALSALVQLVDDRFGEDE